MYRRGGGFISRSEFRAARAAGEQCSCCVSGAVQAVPSGNRDDVWRLLIAAKPGAIPSSHAPTINDRLANQAEAVAWLDRALALAREEERAREEEVAEPKAKKARKQR
jgi:hypothetical protein